MFTQLLDYFAEGNPQLFRELKGRLNRHSLSMIGVLSALIQCVIVGIYSKQNCITWSEDVGGYCQDSQTVIQWESAFVSLTFMLPLLLLAGGVYLLSSDWMKEQRRGTLNFLRLSPRTSQNILLGKLLGVPVLLYIGIGFAIPLHLLCAIAGGIPLGWVFGFYAVLVALGTFLYTASLLNVLFVA
ncbi:ABC transporter permease, partial [Phormidium pseudopriestleyi FRX01]